MAIIAHAATKATSGGTSAAAHRRHNGGAPIPGRRCQRVGTAVTSDNSCASLLRGSIGQPPPVNGDTAVARQCFTPPRVTTSVRSNTSTSSSSRDPTPCTNPVSERPLGRPKRVADRAKAWLRADRQMRQG